MLLSAAASDGDGQQAQQASSTRSPPTAIAFLLQRLTLLRSHCLFTPLPVAVTGNKTPSSASASASVAAVDQRSEPLVTLLKDIDSLALQLVAPTSPFSPSSSADATPASIPVSTSDTASSGSNSSHSSSLHACVASALLLCRACRHPIATTNPHATIALATQALAQEALQLIDSAANGTATNTPSLHSSLLTTPLNAASKTARSLLLPPPPPRTTSLSNLERRDGEGGGVGAEDGVLDGLGGGNNPNANDLGDSGGDANGSAGLSGVEQQLEALRRDQQYLFLLGVCPNAQCGAALAACFVCELPLVRFD